MPGRFRIENLGLRAQGGGFQFRKPLTRCFKLLAYLWLRVSVCVCVMSCFYSVGSGPEFWINFLSLCVNQSGADCIVSRYCTA